MGNSTSEMIATCKDAYASGAVQPRKKCCGKCAFRAGSPERSDPWGWMRAVDGWTIDGVVFFCHEGVPDHDQQEEGVPLQVCAGYHAMKNVEPHVLYDLAHIKGRPKTRNTVEYFEEEAQEAHAQTYCDDCEHLNRESADCECNLDHSIDFKMPQSPVDDDYGLYNKDHKNCPDKSVTNGQ